VCEPESPKEGWTASSLERNPQLAVEKSLLLGAAGPVMMKNKRKRPAASQETSPTKVKKG